MGITGLLPAVRDAAKLTTLASFSGKSAGVDGFVWLHRACLTCARALAHGERTSKYIASFMRQVQLLVDHNVRPLIVFDGADLPAKRPTNDSRRESRLANLQRAASLEGRGLSSEAAEHYARAVGITSEVLAPLYAALRKSNVRFIVAPYEADAQLAYLCLHGVVDFVITEDSDLLAYRCPVTAFKLDREGNCERLAYADLFGLRELAGLTPQAFLEACVLAGCDYLPAIPRMGFRTAVRRMLAHRTAEAVIGGLRLEGKWDVPDEYEARFRSACAIFVQQRVFDPVRGTTVGVHGEPAGDGIPDDLARAIAGGLIDPRTREPLAEWPSVKARPPAALSLVPPRGKRNPSGGKFIPPSLRLRSLSS
jgi:exonuclease-1